MSKLYSTEEERLVAEQAVAAFREARQAMHAAAEGQGLAVTEAAVLDQGRKLLRVMMEQLMSTHPEVQKGGSAPGVVRAEEMPPSSTMPRRC